MSILLTFLLTFAVMLAEGSALDWSATYLSSDLGATAAVAALAFGAFSVTMAIGRFTGDSINRRIGSVRLVRTGAAGASVGLGLGLVLATPLSVIVGFAIMSLIRTVGDMGDMAFGVLPQAQWATIVGYIKETAEVCLAVAMAAVGLGTSIKGLVSIGLKPLAMGLVAALRGCRPG